MRPGRLGCAVGELGQAAAALGWGAAAALLGQARGGKGEGKDWAFGPECRWGRFFPFLFFKFFSFKPFSNPFKICLKYF